MFKRLRERIAEEGIKFPVSQTNTNNSGKQTNETDKAIANSTEDLITLSNSPSVVVPHTSSQQFSIGEDEDGSMSEQNTPKKRNDSFNGSTSEQFYTPSRDNSNSISDLGYGQQYRPSKSHYIPQSDIESEREDPPTLNLENISKEQLLTIIDVLKAKSYKYKNKYSEVVKNFKELRDEKLKIETTLIEHQDKGLRRIAELREQCQLEQKAKAHLEANLRLMLEEKDSRISVLETQINLLKKDQSDGFNYDSNEVQTSDSSIGDSQITDSCNEGDASTFQEKIERVEHQLTQAKKTITNQTEQLSLLRKQNEGLSLELEEKVKALNELEDQLGNVKSQHEFVLKGMQGRLEELENQQEESLMSMAETKKNMHEELEFKEKQLKKAEEEAKQLQITCETEKSKVLELQKRHEEKVKELQRQLESTERMLEDEKHNLMQELGRGKTAALSLMQQECAKKVAAIEEEWKVKLENYESQKSISQDHSIQEKEFEKKVADLKEKLKISESQEKELIEKIQKLNEENSNLKSSLEKSNSEFASTSDILEKMKNHYMDLKESKKNCSSPMEGKSSHQITSSQAFEVVLQASNAKETKLQKHLRNIQILLEETYQNVEVKCLEIAQLQEKVKHCEIQLEIAAQGCDKKNREVIELQKQVEQYQNNVKEKDLCFQNLERDLKKMQAKNDDLKFNLKVMNDNLEKLEINLKQRDEKINFLNDTIEKSTLEINTLTRCVVKKQEEFENLEANLIKIDKDLSKLEKDDFVQSALLNYDSILGAMNDKVDFVLALLKSQDMQDFFAKMVDEKSKTDSKPVQESQQKLRVAEEEDQIKILTPSDEKCDFSSSNVTELQVIIHKLLGENRKLEQELVDLKEQSEVQSIESAKNITLLYESLSQLQDERNNLSLVLQSYESHTVEGEKCNDVKVEKNKTSDGKADQGIDLLELNGKVKSEISALSGQTELINAEFKNLKDQFNLSQVMYSEKLSEMNTRLLRKTETVLKLKEELDESIKNNDDLKNLLEITKEELNKTNDLLDTCKKTNQELDDKLKESKDNFVKMELQLKQQHNSQLTNLKNHTQATIEKLKGEVNKANSLRQEKEALFSVELSKLKECHKEKITEFKDNEIEISKLQNLIKEGFTSSSNFELNFLPSLEKLDSYNCKINKMGDCLKKAMHKLQEKECMLKNQELCVKQFQDLQRVLTKENENLLLELNKKEETLSACQAKWEQENESRNKLEKDFNALKNELSTVVKQSEYSKNSEVMNLKEKLIESQSESKELQNKCEEISQMLNTALSETEELKKQESQLIELQQKYNNLLVSLENSSRIQEEERLKYSEVSKKLEMLIDFLNDGFNSFSLKFQDQFQLCLSKLSKEESKLKNFESSFSKLSKKYKYQSLEVIELKNGMEKLEDGNKFLIGEMKEKNEELELKYNQINESNRILIDDLKTKLNQAEAELKTTQTNTTCQTNELKGLTDELCELKEHKSETERDYETLTKKLAESETALSQLKESYLSAKQEAEKATEVARLSNSKLNTTLKHLESKNVLIASMVPIEKLEECKHVHAIEVEQLNNLVTKLKAEIQNLTSDVKEKDAAVKNLQLEKDNLMNRQDENLKCVTDKLENAERNYSTQMSEMKSRISLLEKEKLTLETEKAELLKVKEKLSDLESGESAIKSELQSKDEELKKLQLKFEASNKDQTQKIQNFQESMKDKENMIVKLKANIANISKENLEKIEDFKKKIKVLEEEREQLMMQAQERVAATEARCRDDIKTLQEKNNKLLLDNKEMEKIKGKCTQLEKELQEIRLQLQSQQAAAEKELTLVKEQLLKVGEQLKSTEKAKEVLEAELSGRVDKLQEENSLLLGKSNHFESLKSEKEELNEKLKRAEQQVTSVKQLETEKETLRKTNTSISQELEQIKTRGSELEAKLKSLEKRELQYKNEMKKLESSNKNLESEVAVLKSSLESEVKEKEDLVKKVSLLEVSQSSKSETMSSKEEEIDQKLKNLVRDFSIQMDNKDKDCDKILAESIEKEEKLLKEHRAELASLRQNMFEKECALDEMRDHYEETLQEKENKLKELQMTIKKLTDNGGSNDSALLTAEGSDWDETWAVPDECIENTSPVHNTEPCKEHLLQIESLQEELSKCNSEIKELKVLLRLSPPESMNNNQRDSYQSLPEPTELEYLKNIIYEYMMGKEPITLAKVIAAVLRFSESQTQQVIRREEAKHPSVSHWLSPK